MALVNTWLRNPLVPILEQALLDRRCESLAEARHTLLVLTSDVCKMPAISSFGSDRPYGPWLLAGSRLFRFSNMPRSLAGIVRLLIRYVLLPQRFTNRD